MCAPEQSTITAVFGTAGLAVDANPTPDAAIAVTAAAPAMTALTTPARFDNSCMVPTRSLAARANAAGDELSHRKTALAPSGCIGAPGISVRVGGLGGQRGVLDCGGRLRVGVVELLAAQQRDQPPRDRHA